MEAQPDLVLVLGIPKGDVGGSPSKENDDMTLTNHLKMTRIRMIREDWKSIYRSEINPTPESSESHNLDNQLVESSKCCNLAHEITLYFSPSEFTKEKPVASRETSIHFVWEYIVLFHVLRYISSLYIIILKYSCVSWKSFAYIVLSRKPVCERKLLSSTL